MADVEDSRQAGAENFFDRKYVDWTPSKLAVPDGLTRAQIEAATRLVFAWKESGDPYSTPLVLEIFACLSRDEGQSPKS